jgi:putative ABC transport system permease protein
MIPWLTEVLELGARNVRGHPLRALLTMLGVVLGVSSVILMRAVGAGAEAEILREMGRLGIDNVIVNSVKPPERKQSREQSWVHSYGLRFKDVAHLESTVNGIEKVLPVHAKTDRVWAGGRKVEATIYGITPAHLDLLGIPIARGRGLAPLDADGMKRTCVVRPSLFRELGVFDDPLGAWLQIGEEFYRVVGLIEDRKVPGYASKALALDQKRHDVYVPFETLVGRRGTMAATIRTGSFEATDVQLNQIVVGVTNVDQVIGVSQQIARALAKRHEDKDYEIVVPIEYLRQRQKTQDVFDYAFLAIASVSLVVGGIGIANIMLATVTERTREIGIRRALGATQADVLFQFLAETLVIAAAGGLVGVFAGYLFDAILRGLTGWSTVVHPSSVLLGLGVSVATGVLSGIYPARRAALLDPIAALRQ